MGLVEIIILAIVQGLTEFLPVSSDGHLAVAYGILEAVGYSPPDDPLEVTIVLHMGTLLAIVIFYWRELLALLTRDRRLIPLLVVGTIPAVIVGLPLKFYASHWLTNPALAGICFAITALMLYTAARLAEGSLSYRELSYPAVFRIGLWQATALLPGISRSGATISSGLREGLDRRSATTFSFLLGTPAIAGAGLLEIAHLLRERGILVTSSDAEVITKGEPTSLALLLVGGAVSMVVGLFALAWLIRWVQQGRLAVFAWYLVLLSVAVCVWQLLSAVRG